jgi:hypothetical protein
MWNRALGFRGSRNIKRDAAKNRIQFHLLLVESENILCRWFPFVLHFRSIVKITNKISGGQGHISPRQLTLGRKDEGERGG